MAFDARALTVFIASPGDTRRERDAIEKDRQTRNIWTWNIAHIGL
jgi:hypothetical protein